MIDNKIENTFELCFNSSRVTFGFKTIKSDLIKFSQRSRDCRRSTPNELWEVMNRRVVRSSADNNGKKPKIVFIGAWRKLWTVLIDFVLFCGLSKQSTTQSTQISFRGKPSRRICVNAIKRCITNSVRGITDLWGICVWNAAFVVIQMQFNEKSGAMAQFNDLNDDSLKNNTKPD